MAIVDRRYRKVLPHQEPQLQKTGAALQRKWAGMKPAPTGVERPRPRGRSPDDGEDAAATGTQGVHAVRPYEMPG